MDERHELKRKSEAYRRKLLALADALSTLRDYPVKQEERNRRKRAAYEAKLRKIDRLLEDI
jgi:hypothetical protein